MASLFDINNKLKNIVNIAGFDKVASQANSVAANINALESTSLGNLINENISGIQGLNTSAGKANIALLQSNLTGLTDQVVKDVSSSKTDLQSITGASDGVEDGFLDFVFTAASAEGVKAAVNVVASPTEAQLKTILTNIVPEQFSNQVSNIVGQDFTKFTQDLSSTVTSFSSTFNNLLNGKTGNVLQDILLQTDTAPISAIVGLGVDDNVAADVLLLLQKDDIKAAVNLVKSKSSLNLSTQKLEQELAKVPTDVSDQITSGSVKSSSLPTFDVTTNFNNWNGKSTADSYFSVVATFEELMIEMVNTNREITEIVFYGYEITEDQAITPADIHRTHIAAGLNGIAYHYVVLPNGDIRRGRSLSVDGEHNSGHNQYSIAVVVPHIDGAPATVNQARTIDLMLEAFWNIWPGGQCWDGKNDIDISLFEVGVNIDNYRSKSRKQNFGTGDRSFSTAQLIAAGQGAL